ncbi:MAG: enoyl-CoA hydratase/isomerase family protein [Proteobacteria bacterium]|nr:enoyl-CoA hydratase/isomerase family protein [Pseudomonadota bacterium]MBI3496705.1 enoyl-CoA hydratase/isomerase family protein [Pseudomonadota bacterium]
MSETAVRMEVDRRGVATVTLNRPEVHNAFGEALIAELATTFRGIAADQGVRVMVLAGNGESFSAGADLTWMKRLSAASPAENMADSLNFAEMLRELAEMPKPTIARVHGAAFGGGVGLVAACDIAIASEAAVFALSEVRLGLIPAVISPYVTAAMGPRHAGRYAISGERLDASAAHRLGLVHEVVAKDGLDAAIARAVEELLTCGPEAQADAKRLIRDVADRPIDGAIRELTASRIAHRRATAEGKEGVAAFLEKRKPAWMRA